MGKHKGRAKQSETISSFISCPIKIYLNFNLQSLIFSAFAKNATNKELLRRTKFPKIEMMLKTTKQMNR